MMFPLGRAAQRTDKRPLLGEYPDYTLAHNFGLEQQSAGASDNQTALEAGIRANGLMIQETVTDGDCGLHAILFNLQRLRFQTEPAARILSLLEKKSLDSACQALRLSLAIWLRDLPAEELIPDTSLSDWVRMEGYSSFGAYLKHMKVAKTWIDSPMLYAASALFRLQLVIFLDDGRPHLLAARVIEQQESGHLALLANIRRCHFQALQPLPPENFSPCKSSADTLLLQVPETQDDADDSAPEATDGEAAPVPYQNCHAEKTIQLCQALINWDPFSSACDPQLPDLVKSLESTDEPSEVLSQTLQWRAAVKLLQHEEFDRAEVDRSFHLELARINVVKRTTPARQKMFYVKSRTLGPKLTLAAIKISLVPPCHKNNAPRSCLDAFRNCPNLVLRWRKMWYSLPKADRQERLRSFFATAKQQQEAEGQDEFRMHFSVFGQSVCRDAFIRITGIHADTLQRARSAAVTGVLHHSEIAAWRSRRHLPTSIAEPGF